MKILNAFIEKGLNPQEGTSEIISVAEIEILTNKRLTGNGSIVRRDTKPWSLFNLENIKESGSVIGYKFHGYKTRRELIGELRHQNESSQRRRVLEHEKIEERENKIRELTSQGRLDEAVFSIADIERYI